LLIHSFEMFTYESLVGTIFESQELRVESEDNAAGHREGERSSGTPCWARHSKLNRPYDVTQAVDFNHRLSRVSLLHLRICSVAIRQMSIKAERSFALKSPS